MSQSKKNEKDKPESFSFDRDPGQLGGGGDGSEFTFTDVPVLGKHAKDKASFSFDELSSGKDSTAQHDRKDAGQKTDPGVASFELLMAEQGKPDGESAAPGPSSKSGSTGFHGTAAGARFKNALSLGKKKPTVLAVAAAVALLAAAGAAGFFLFVVKKQEPQPANVDAEGVVKPVSKADKEKAKAAAAEKMKLEQLANELTSADSLASDGKFADAIAAYQKIEQKNYRKAYLYFKMAKSHEWLKDPEKALEYYQKSIEAGPEDSAPYAAMISYLNGQKKYEEALGYIKKCRGKFPDDAGISLVAAQTYFVLNKHDDSLQEFKKATRTELDMRQLKMFGSLLAGKNQKDEAREAYLDAFHKFGDTDSLDMALKLVEKSEEKIAILRHVVESKEKSDTAKKTFCSILLAEALDKAGKKDEMAKQLDSLDPSYLEGDMTLRFLRLLFSGSTKAEMVESASKKVIKANHASVPLLEKIQDVILNHGPKLYDELRLKIFSDLLTENEDDPVFLYMYGRSLGIASDTAKKYFEKAAARNPVFFEAQLAYGNLLLLDRDWKKAIKAFGQCSLIQPDNGEIRHLLAVCMVRAGDGDEGYGDYKKFLLENQKLPPSKAAARMIRIAQLMPSPEKAEECLAEMKKDPEMKKKYDLENVRTKFIYGKIADSDFSSRTTGEMREFYMIYLLSKGRSKDVLMLKTPPAEFPEFWKVFLCWKDDIPSWNENAEILREKNKDNPNPVYRMIVSLWQNKLSPDDAREMINKIPTESEALFYFMLAEKYRKDKNMIKAKICYTKAKGDRQNPIFRLVDYYSRDMQ